MARMKPKVGKVQLVQELSAHTTLPKEQCSFMYEVFLDIVKKHLMNEETVGLVGIGQFYFSVRQTARSNMTGGIIPKHKQLKFKVSEGLSRFIRMKTREY